MAFFSLWCVSELEPLNRNAMMLHQIKIFVFTIKSHNIFLIMPFFENNCNILQCMFFFEKEDD